MSITYYSIIEKIFAASSGEIHGRESIIGSTPAHLDQADRANPARDRISPPAYMCNCEQRIKLERNESGWSNYD
jgi:hypothetical protein